MAGIEAVVIGMLSLEAVLMGTLHRQPGGKGGVLSFKYTGSWLDKSDAFTIDSDLTVDDRHQYPTTGSSNFGIFRESSPDRWGRVLMQRWENLGARIEGVHSRRLMEWDFLLGACDEIRLGALRLKVPGGPYLSNRTGSGRPPVASLRELQLPSLQFERHFNDEEHPDYAKSPAQLIAPGSSLGGDPCHDRDFAYRLLSYGPAVLHRDSIRLIAVSQHDDPFDQTRIGDNCGKSHWVIVKRS